MQRKRWQLFRAKRFWLISSDLAILKTGKELRIRRRELVIAAGITSFADWATNIRLVSFARNARDAEASRSHICNLIA